jgi:hypothetical protein
MWQRTGRRRASLNLPKAYCAQNGAVRETKLELEFSRYEVYEEKIREVYRPKGLLAFTTAAREYVKIGETDEILSLSKFILLPPYSRGFRVPTGHHTRAHRGEAAKGG